MSGAFCMDHTDSLAGLDASHALLPFYEDVDVHKEDARLKQKIIQLQKSGLQLVHHSLDTDSLCESVAAGSAAIVLVDTRFLPYASLYLSMQPSYLGHFVLVVCLAHFTPRLSAPALVLFGAVQYSYSFESNLFSLMDPAGGASECGPHLPMLIELLQVYAALETCSPEALQLARDQPGTDQDVLLVTPAAASNGSGSTQCGKAVTNS